MAQINMFSPTVRQDTPKTSEPHPLSGSERLKRFTEYCFAKHDPSNPIPPAPGELVDWAENTAVATFLGVLLEGGRKLIEEKRSGAIIHPVQERPSLHAARAMAEAQTQRIARIADAGIRGGFRIGGFAAVFYGVALLVGIARGQRDYYNTSVGGVVAGSMLGIMVADRRKLLKSAALAAVLGGSVGVPIGLLQDFFISSLPQDLQDARRDRIRQTEDIINGVQRTVPLTVDGGNSADAVIQQLEKSLEIESNYVNRTEGK